MTPVRLVLVANRYWPHSGDLECVASHLAEGLQELNVRVTVITGSWAANWPKSLVVRGVPVTRLAHAPRGGWSTFRYLTAMSRWLRAHRSEYDLVYVLNLRYEAYAAIGASEATGKPTLLRCQDWGVAGDGWWQTQARFGSRVKHYCQRAAAIVTSDSCVTNELVGCGYSPERLREIPLGIVAGEPRSADRRFHARAALADANHDLTAAEYAPVAVVISRLDDITSLSNLLIEWQDIATRWPSSRLWFIGDGSARNALGEKLVDLDLRYQVFLPGVFEDWTDLFHAADVMIWPAPQSGRQILLEAMAAGLPSVLTDSPDLRAMMEHGKHVVLVPANSPGAWTAAVTQLFEAPPIAAEIGASAAKLVAARYSRRQMAEAHCELFEQILAPRL